MKKKPHQHYKSKWISRLHTPTHTDTHSVYGVILSEIDTQRLKKVFFFFSSLERISQIKITRRKGHTAKKELLAKTIVRGFTQLILTVLIDPKYLLSRISVH